MCMQVLFFLHTNFLHLCPLSWYLFVHVCVQHFLDDIVAKGQMLTELNHFTSSDANYYSLTFT